MKKIVTIGGGTGQFGLLSGLKRYPVELTAIVAMSDDGGSTGVLRDELGVLPPGDVRQCLVALSESDQVMRELFSYRYGNGVLEGHSFGNLFLSTLEKMTGSFEEAVAVAGKVLAIRGQVIPVTTENVTLVCGDGCRGQSAVDGSVLRDRAGLRLDPEANANPKAIEAIERADLVVIGPGNLYCSVIPNFLAKGLPEAIGRSKARVVYNCNLMNKAGHTDGYTVIDHVGEIERFVGRGRVDFVTYNNRLPSNRDILERYGEEGKSLVPVASLDEDFGETTFRPLPADLVSGERFVQKPGDPLRRTLIRHDADALAALIIGHCLVDL
ncbi:YvcK family protein [Candidatus Uhrbacteria bacterium]|nr:YvcK family protein [Candidatus Uhrbacteria bacterium]